MMRREYKTFILLFLFGVTSIFFFSCSKEDELGLDLQSPYGSWRLEKFISAENSKTQWLTVANFSNFYLLTLNAKDNSFSGTTSSNRINGSFIYDPNQRDDKLSFSDPIIKVTSNKENSDGDLYLRYLKAVRSFRVFYDSKREAKFLHLYLTDKKNSYLEYREVEALSFDKK